MIVSHELRYVYIAIPKTGSTTMNDILTTQFAGEYVDPHHLAIVPEECEGYFVFSVVRNPYNRMKSLWKHAKRSVYHRLHEVACQQTFRQFCLWHADLTIWPEVPFQEVEYTYWSDAFALDKYKGREPCQSEFLSEANPTAVLRIEKIKEDFERLPFADYAAARPSLVLNRDPDGRNASVSHDLSLDSSIAKAINKWAEADFDRYAYSRW